MKIFWFAVLLSPYFALGQSAITNSAGYGEELPSAACLSCPGADWNNPENITAADGTTTIAGLNHYGNCFMSNCFYSRYLYAHHFNFAIPLDATIDSIFVDIKRGAFTMNAIRDSIVQLQKRDSIVGDNLHSSNLWPIVQEYESYGHNKPLWGTTWLPADLNDTASGVVMKIINLSDSVVQAEVDHIQMTVYFTTTTGIHSVTSSPSDIEWLITPRKIEMNFNTTASLECFSRIYTFSGQKVLSNHFGKSLRGQNHFHCSTENLATGIYFIMLNIGRKSYLRKFAVIK